MDEVAELLEDTWEIYRRLLAGPAGGRARCGALRRAGGRTALGQAGSPAEARRLWRDLWLEIAAAAPASFLVSPRRLSAGAPTAAYAFLYARRQQAGIRPYRPSRAVAGRLRAAVDFLREAGVPALERGRLWTFDERCQALRRMGALEGLVGWAFVGERALAGEGVLDGRYLRRLRRRKDGREEVALVVHELTHLGFALSSPLAPGLLASPLRYALYEAATSLLELCALERRARRGTLAAQAASHPYVRTGDAPVDVLLSLLPGERAPTIARAAADFLRRLQAARSDREAGALVLELGA